MKYEDIKSPQRGVYLAPVCKDDMDVIQSAYFCGKKARNHPGCRVYPRIMEDFVGSSFRMVGSTPCEMTVELPPCHPVWRGFELAEDGKLPKAKGILEEGKLASDLFEALIEYAKQGNIPNPASWVIAGKLPSWAREAVLIFIGNCSGSPVKICYRGTVVTIA